MGKVPAFKKKKKSKLSFFILLAVVLAFCGYVVFRSVALNNTKSQLESEITDINAKIDEEEKRAEDLKEQETFMHTKKYAEEVAKDVLGYVYEDEIIFKPE